jgi:hypothetical protein
MFDDESRSEVMRKIKENCPEMPLDDIDDAIEESIVLYKKIEEKVKLHDEEFIYKSLISILGILHKMKKRIDDNDINGAISTSALAMAFYQNFMEEDL